MSGLALADLLSSVGLQLDESHILRVLDLETHGETKQLKDGCKEFLAGKRHAQFQSSHDSHRS